ncbi:MAG: hypothetical protein K0R39_1531 [Symbiobacteriaceae bacterium]|jgi:hypothetical protein|nr:hypothetical protein [Symbiobacteriaceae bacterium]
MNEQALSQELHRVADAAPVPADLFLPGLLEGLGARPALRRRRSGWLVAAAVAAAVLLIFLVTPPGNRLVSAAGDLVLRITVKREGTDVPKQDYAPLRWPLAIGESTDQVVNGRKMVLTRMHRQDWPADLPLPALNPPGDLATIYRQQGFDASTGKLLFTTWEIHWDGFQLSYRRYPKPRPPETMGGGYLVVPANSEVQEETVTLKGQPATAVRAGELWLIQWQHADGAGLISGRVDLDILVKVAESLPELK